MEKEDVIKAKYWEWQTSLFGACFIAFGLGTWLGGYIRPLLPGIILFGVFIHAWGMYKIHQRNK